MATLFLSIGFSKSMIILMLFLILNTSGQNTSELIYILIWTSTIREPWKFIGRGEEPFSNCKFQNCFLTEHRDYFSAITYFDVILFNAEDLIWGISELPYPRIEKQIYVLHSIEPAGRFSVPYYFNGFFNMTWTYKLGSDVPFPYMLIKNKRGEIIGPKKNVEWNYNPDNVTVRSTIANRLLTKNKAAAIIFSNCIANNGGRTGYAYGLRDELEKLGHKLDLYGSCGDLECPRGENMSDCFSKIDSDYFFYLSFENSYCEDYVTEKLLNALHHYAVPVVLGGAAYQRFLPDGTYINAEDTLPRIIASRMNEIILDRNKYLEFFKWHSFYSYHSTRADNYTDAMCNVCALLNNKTRREQRTFYKKITRWWNGWYDNIPKRENEVEEITHDGIVGFVQKLYFRFFE